MKFLGSKFILGWTFSTGGHHCMYYQLVAEAGKNMKSLRGKLMRKHPVRSRCPAYNFTLKLTKYSDSFSLTCPTSGSFFCATFSHLYFICSIPCNFPQLPSLLSHLLPYQPHVVCSGLFVAYANVIVLMIDCLTRECSR